jgi:hypothetical protein
MVEFTFRISGDRLERLSAPRHVAMDATIEGDDLIVSVTNTSTTRPVSIQAVGVAAAREPDGFDAWNRINDRLSSGSSEVLADPPVPKMLEVGAPAHTVKAPMPRVKGSLHPDRPVWVWSTDSYGTTRWWPIPRDVADKIIAVKRRVLEPDRAGGLIGVDLEDDEDLAGRRLA